MFTWLLSNEAETVWRPSASLQLDAGLFGECTPVDEVGLGDVSPVVCNVLIAANMAPMSEPSFTLVLNDAGVDYTTTVGLLVAPNEQVSWDIGAVPVFTTGQERQVTVEITNTGNTALQRQVVVNAPSTWSVSVDGSDILDLNVGQSALVRLNVRADSPGSETVSLELSQSTAAQPTFTFAVSSTGEPTGTGGESGLDSTLAVALLMAVLFVAFAALGVQVLRNRDETEQTPSVHALPVPVHAPPVPAQPAPQAAVSQPSAADTTPSSATPPMCWTCRQPITSAMIGCPACGARYHADAAGGCTAPNIEACVNCGGPSSAFVKA